MKNRVMILFFSTMIHGMEITLYNEKPSQTNDDDIVVLESLFADDQQLLTLPTVLPLSVTEQEHICAACKKENILQSGMNYCLEENCFSINGQIKRDFKQPIYFFYHWLLKHHDVGQKIINIIEKNGNACSACCYEPLGKSEYIPRTLFTHYAFNHLVHTCRVFSNREVVEYTHRTIVVAENPPIQEPQKPIDNECFECIREMLYWRNPEKKRGLVKCIQDNCKEVMSSHRNAFAHLLTTHYPSYAESLKTFIRKKMSKMSVCTVNGCAEARTSNTAVFWHIFETHLTHSCPDAGSESKRRRIKK